MFISAQFCNVAMQCSNTDWQFAGPTLQIQFSFPKQVAKFRLIFDKSRFSFSFHKSTEIIPLLLKKKGCSVVNCYPDGDFTSPDRKPRSEIVNVSFNLRSKLEFRRVVPSLATRTQSLANINKNNNYLNSISPSSLMSIKSINRSSCRWIKRR